MKMKFAFIFQLLIIIFRQISEVDGACTLPTILDGTWWDSRTNGAVSFTQSTGKVPSDWNVATFNSFTCVESDNSYWLFQSDNTKFSFGLNYYGFYCVRYTKITDNSYSYYLDSDVEPDAESVRLTVLPESNVLAGITISSVCSPTSGPGAEEFHVLVKENQQANVKQWFPDAILGQYAYSVTDASSTTTCGAGSMWDACTNRTTVTFNYTQCNTVMFGSNDGELYATQSATSGSTTYVIVINGDATPASTNIFTCLAVSGTSVSSNPGSCVQGQSATSRTSSSDSILISLSPYELCPFSSASSSSSSSNIGLIAGVVVVVLILIGGVVAFIVYFKVIKKKPFPWQKTKVQNINEENNEKRPPGIDSPRVAVDIDVPAEKKQTLPPIKNAGPKIEVNKNEPLPAITRQ